MSSSTDPENLPPRRHREDETPRSGSNRAADADDAATRSFDQAPARSGDRGDYYPEPTAERAYEPAPTAAAPVVDRGLADRETAVARQRERFGGIKAGSAFFGWLTATGMAVLLTALVAAAGMAVGLASNTDVNEAVNQAAQNTGTVGLVGIIVLLVILFLSYYCGGYVAGRMARFNGAKQGLMVWIWALIAAILIAVLGTVAGQQFNVLASLNSFPRIPINEGQLTTTSIIAAVVVAAVALVGAVLGGLAGMRFHRKVDRAGFTPDSEYYDDDK
ncbi:MULTISPECIES: TIGR04086 family membrane protein [unclassified Arthrobacter]|uniref:TIGR04086 family membrane protein n=1 Tax=unclassified Arthrobacter TaxID=235627 RepID=UPI001C858F0A|nr:TIGR04086 family membrane protein [Arthrobacter sp. MAHUQ-56]MBX7443060.1 TIGR04086 family membrane protein [Arthrobacter sp. MAHUQ-56]